MDFDLLEKLSENWKKSKDLQIEKQIIDLICTNNKNHFAFPIAEKCQISSGRVGFIYKDNKTYPNLFEFLAHVTCRQIPLEINNCHFGPGEIVVIRDNKGDALGDLILSSNEIVKSIKSKLSK